jgi:ABC-type Na+ efflux pump permease subunit
MISNKSDDWTAVAIILLFVAFWLAAIGGWIANIVKIFATAAEPLTAYFIIRCIGVVVAPVGAVLGFL